MHVDLRRATVAELADFIFDHPIAEPDDEGRRREWYWAEPLEVAIDPEHQMATLAALFRGATSLRTRFSPEQLEQGLWFIFGPGGDEWFASLLADEDTPWDARAAAVESIYDLYDNLLAHVELDTATYMLWDLVLDQFYNADARDYVLHDHVADVCFHTLGRILGLSSPACQRAALHGLGHLQHPNTRSLVSAYLETNPPADDELRLFAEQVRSGEDIL